ncbi:hypothetical protein H6F98_22175 [Microcoleus sp. FACHB-SPT15]|uniref:hypothetical protein n=1 Tax=Microcoleus sp. FACHB-SPT15 TaxID=2692830 RepID=UPI001784E472|nr:hypothetical protein [Microcoleus sp. FACHB-SPT15]MBD1808141.1 hypothetical protein [Microcoleus sp. FACHB-SPT15]
MNDGHSRGDLSKPLKKFLRPSAIAIITTATAEWIVITYAQRNWVEVFYTLPDARPKAEL